jgi:hypothetical protein
MTSSEQSLRGLRPWNGPLDTAYGDRRAMVRDPFGNVFQIAHRNPDA